MLSKILIPYRIDHTVIFINPHYTRKPVLPIFNIESDYSKINYLKFSFTCKYRYRKQIPSARKRVSMRNPWFQIKI